MRSLYLLTRVNGVQGRSFHGNQGLEEASGGWPHGRLRHSMSNLQSREAGTAGVTREGRVGAGGGECRCRWGGGSPISAPPRARGCGGWSTGLGGGFRRIGADQWNGATIGALLTSK